MRRWLWRYQSRFPLPVITLSNVHLVSNKLVELMLWAKHDWIFRQNNLVSLMELWLKDYHEMPTLPGYTTLRSNRHEHSPRKSTSGGYAFSWMKAGLHNIAYGSVCEHRVIPSPSNLFISHGSLARSLWALPEPNDMAARERIMESYRKALARSVYQPIFVFGDFISCNLSNQLPNLHQYVDCPTCLIQMLDHCYGNMSEAYKAVCRPPLGKSDHNVIHHLPK